MCTTLCTVEGHPPILRNSPLQIVAVELRFPEAFLEVEDLKKIKRGLAEHYPVPDTERGLAIEVGPQGLRSQQSSQRQVYRSRDGSHQVGLTSTALVLEARGGAQYEGFHHFLDRWLFALDAVKPVAEIETQLRLGLRYVNQLPVEDSTRGVEALVGRINMALLSPHGVEGFDFEITTSFEELRIRDEHGKATFRHGLQTSSDEGSALGVYVLDLDYYDDELAEFDLDRHVEQLKLFNSQVWQIFRWSLTEEEYQRMQPEDRDDTAR
jgi:uncharacterized protein (TIGR04255 family)